MIVRKKLPVQQALCLLILTATMHPFSWAFTVVPQSLRITKESKTTTLLRVSIKNNNNNNGESDPKEENQKRSKDLGIQGQAEYPRGQQQQSILYNRNTSIREERRRRKEEACRERKIAIYHNKLQKNANDCSVCTKPDKIDRNKIATSKKNQTNGVTQVSTPQKSLLQIKQDVNQLIREPSVELADALLILASSFFVAMSTVPILPPQLMNVVYFGQEATLYLFAFGFLSRWLSSLEPRGTYLQQDPLEWVDLIVVVLPFLFLTVPGLADYFPSWLTSQTSLINLRLLRVLRFQRILQDEITFSKFVEGLPLPWPDRDALSCVIVECWQLQLARVLLSIFTLLSVATGLIYSAEHVVNPGITDYFSALYFGLTTLTTVGFGDVTPVTWQGKLVVSGSILAGVAVIPAQAAALVEALLARDANYDVTNNNNNNNLLSPLPPPMSSSPPPPPPPPAASVGRNLVLETTQTCPQCGAGLHWAQASYCYNCGAKLSIHTPVVVPEEDTMPDK